MDRSSQPESRLATSPTSASSEGQQQDNFAQGLQPCPTVLLWQHLNVSPPFRSHTQRTFLNSAKEWCCLLHITSNYVPSDNVNGNCFSEKHLSYKFFNYKKEASQYLKPLFPLDNNNHQIYKSDRFSTRATILIPAYVYCFPM